MINYHLSIRRTDWQNKLSGIQMQLLLYVNSENRINVTSVTVLNMISGNMAIEANYP